MKTVLLFMSMWLFAGITMAERIVTLLDLQKPKTITVKDGQIFVTENVLIKVYSATDYRLLHTFGKRGEGPGEFKIMDNAEIGIGVQISVQPEYILANSIGRISYFSRSGEFIREMNTQLGRGPYGHNFTPVGDLFVGYGFRMEGQVRYVTINLYDRSIKKVKELYRHLFFVQPGKKSDPEIWRPSLFYVSRNRIVIDREDGIIDIFNQKGEKIRSITHPYPRVKETQTRIQDYLDFLKKDPRFREDFDFYKKMLEFPEYLPLIRFFSVDDERIYVLTNQKKAEKSQLLIFDYRGKILKKTWVKLAEKTPIEPYPYTIRDGILYQLKENLEEEEWELHIHKIL